MNLTLTIELGASVDRALSRLEKMFPPVELDVIPDEPKAAAAVHPAKQTVEAVVQKSPQPEAVEAAVEESQGEVVVVKEPAKRGRPRKQTTEAVQEPPVAEAPTPLAPSPEANKSMAQVTLDSLVDAAKRAYAKKGRGPLDELLAKYKIKRVSDLPAECYADFALDLSLL